MFADIIKKKTIVNEKTKISLTKREDGLEKNRVLPPYRR